MDGACARSTSIFSQFPGLTGGWSRSLDDALGGPAAHGAARRTGRLGPANPCDWGQPASSLRWPKLSRPGRTHRTLLRRRDDRARGGQTARPTRRRRLSCRARVGGCDTWRCPGIDPAFVPFPRNPLPFPRPSSLQVAGDDEHCSYDDAGDLALRLGFDPRRRR